MENVYIDNGISHLHLARRPSEEVDYGLITTCFYLLFFRSVLLIIFIFILGKKYRRILIFASHTTVGALANTFTHIIKTQNDLLTLN